MYGLLQKNRSKCDRCGVKLFAINFGVGVLKYCVMANKYKGGKTHIVGFGAGTGVG